MQKWENWAIVGAGVLVGLAAWRMVIAGVLPAAVVGSKSNL
jgi:hypothetical protein